MIEIKINIIEDDTTGRVALNVNWGDWDTSTLNEKLMLAGLHQPMVELLKNLPVGKLVGHAQADTPEEAKRICGLIADIHEAGMEGKVDE